MFEFGIIVNDVRFLHIEYGGILLTFGYFLC